MTSDMPKFTRPRNVLTPGHVLGHSQSNEHTLDPSEQRERVRSAWADFFTKEDNETSKENIKATEAKEPELPASTVSPPLQSENPRKPIMCQICGKAFAVPAFPAHQKLCLSVWRRANKHPNPHADRHKSAKSDYVFKADGSLDCKATYDRIWENHLDSLVPCPNCSRKFFEERIETHVNACKGAERADSSMQAAWRNHLSQLIPCKKCGRTFNPDRIEVHERCCRGQHV